ncbi:MULTISPECIES: ATP-dependent Clp protease adaptor ClpS [Capnocytophaga]|uniref:ATP-dependent Clp protease adaptor protein ClpS n=1 Tax=Capnocytophaga canis TaxID=1848903 RepID=A0A0B7I111_9FLAO|nr:MULTISPECIES: ATP-dependent Clp protease adaptor ClpS [Capnocytophaga]ATA71971.1 Clp protease ClpS [Capnocytophaga sp. H4358]ATA74089.1 Clp protease ClpS [Capnocytophaga sp. H2931]RIY37353.1 Clp protease ClpS [Capnocytophaga canis]CEN45360.1 ATP-dependent Clp protease adaptor protein ClpS [Capnocytophaga canis]CEN49340.1 ATP-dependent Clp protease adaptor protein ClpS [Capnocytophaga canis]
MLIFNHKEQTQTETETLVEELLDREYHLVLYNDDVNTFDHVIDTLVRVCDHTYEQAEQCAIIVHYKGKCDVKSGTYKTLEPMCTALLNADLSAEIE